MFVTGSNLQPQYCVTHHERANSFCSFNTSGRHLNSRLCSSIALILLPWILKNVLIYPYTTLNRYGYNEIHSVIFSFVAQKNLRIQWVN